MNNWRVLRVKHGAFPKGGNLSENQRHQLAAAAFWNFQRGEGKKCLGPIEPPAILCPTPAPELSHPWHSAPWHFSWVQRVDTLSSEQPWSTKLPRSRSLKPASPTCTRALPCTRLNVLLPALLAPPLHVPSGLTVPALAERCEKLISTICFAARISADLMLPSRCRADLDMRAFTKRSDGSCKVGDPAVFFTFFLPSVKTLDH